MHCINYPNNFASSFIMCPFNSPIVFTNKNVYDPRMATMRKILNIQRKLTKHANYAETIACIRPVIR